MSKPELVLMKKIDKNLAEWLEDLLETMNDPELSLEERSFAMLQISAVLFGPDGHPKGH
jgi:hypothetical protein